MRRTPYLAAVLVSMSWATALAAPVNGDQAMVLDPAAAARSPVSRSSACTRSIPTTFSHTLDGDAIPFLRNALNPAFTMVAMTGISDVPRPMAAGALGASVSECAFRAGGPGRTLARSLTAENIAGEMAYLQRAHRASFERPYGLAWLLQHVGGALRGLGHPASAASGRA